MKGLYSIVYLSVFFCAIFLKSQEKEPCVNLIKRLESVYKVTFNYQTNQLKEIDCLPYKPTLNLQKQLSLIEEQTGLTFKKLGENRYIIQNDVLYELQILNQKNEPVQNAKIQEFSFNSNQFGKIYIQEYHKSIPTTITITHSNYESQTIQLTKKKEQIRLQNTVIELNEVALTPLFTTGIYKSADGNFSLKPKEVTLLAGTTQQDVIKTIQQLPNVFSLNESVSNISIKAGTNDQNLVLWNNMRLYQNSHFFGLISAFNENLIDQINIYDNATPAKFGNSVSGTVEIKSKQEFKPETKAGVGLNFLSADAFLTQPINPKMSIAFSARRSFTDFFNSPTYTSYEEQAFQDSFLTLENETVTDNIERSNSFYFQDAEIHYQWKPNEKWQLNLNGIAFENDLNYKEENLTLNQIRDSELQQKNFAFGGDITFKLNKKNRLSLSSSYSNHNSDGRNFTFSTGQESLQNNEVEDYRTTFNWEKQLNKNIQLSNGLAYNGLRVLNSFENNLTQFRLFDLNINNTVALFNEFDFSNQKLKLKIGNRTVYYSKTNDLIFEPRVYLGYQFSDRIEANLRAERKSQNIVQTLDLENNFLGIERRRWYLSDNEIYPVQLSEQVEVGVNYKKSLAQISVSAFYRTIHDITTNSQGFRNQNQFNDEVGDAETIGILFHTNFKWRTFNLWMSYSFLNEEFNFSDLTPQTFRGNNDIEHRVVVGCNYKLHKFIFSLGGEYHTGAPYTNINLENPVILGTINRINYASVNKAQLKDYFRLDTSVQYKHQFKNKTNLKITLGIINFTGQSNIISRDFRLQQVTDTMVQVIENKGLRFAPNIGLQLFFNEW